MRLAGSRLLMVLVASALMASWATACGDEESGANKPSDAFAEDYVKRVTRVLATSPNKLKCLRMTPFNSAASVPIPCPFPKKARQSLKRFAVTDSAVYGAGAVVDYTSGDAPNGASVVLVRRPTGDWAISRFGLVGGPTVGTDDGPSRVGFDKGLAGYLDSARKGSCKQYDAFVLSAYEGNRKHICKKELRQTRALVKTFPKLAKRYVGGNSQFGFYLMTASKPESIRRTVIVVKVDGDSGSPYQVLDSVPAPTPEPTSMSPSSTQTVPPGD